MFMLLQSLPTYAGSMIDWETQAASSQPWDGAVSSAAWQNVAVDTVLDRENL